MAMIQTATGQINTANLGFTLMHEHVICVDHSMRAQYPDVFHRPTELQRAIAQLVEVRETGVQTLVDGTPIDLGRDPGFIRDVARGSGMQIIVATGFYYQVPYRFMYRPSAELVDLMVRDITTSIGDSGVRAGVIKCATEPTMHRMNERVVRASAKAHRKTGVPIYTHTYPANKTGLDQIRVFREEGVDLARVVIGHSDDSGDLTYLEEILQSGAYCGMDRIGVPNPFTSEQRADMVVALVERGYADRIVLSHDASCHIDHFADGAIEKHMPDWKFTYIPRRFLSMLRERGVSDSVIDQMTVGNPRRIFEQVAPY
ncbi:MAG: phosphotriesterase [Candidatus Tectomicrobia bacterium]|uniref:Phosphotriesterase n=1 Tax=Tectimicrobiota bacterium TaxID=2528274 RepID=A0A933LRE6_UNCTE|nr:phosphotriesterase [Candidatus Tectomicrobia bacterium]